MVSNVLYSTLFRRNIRSKLEPSFVEDIKMAVGFGGVRCEYVQWLIFMYKVTSKIKFDVLLRKRVVLEKRHSDVFRSKIDAQVAP